MSSIKELADKIDSYNDQKKKIKTNNIANKSFIFASELFAGVIVGFIFGYCADRYFATKPWLMIFFIIFGIFGGLRNIYKNMTRNDL